MGLYTEYNGKPLEGFKWRSDMICLCSKHYGCYVKNRLRRATDRKTSWEVIAIIHVTDCDGSNQSGSSEDGKQWLDSTLGWKLQRYAHSCLWMCPMTLLQAIQDLGSVHICNLIFPPLLGSYTMTTFNHMQFLDCVLLIMPFVSLSIQHPLP